MRILVNLDTLHKRNQHDPKKTARQLEAMQQTGITLNLQVRDPNSAEVFHYLPGGRKLTRRRVLRWLLSPQALLASFAFTTYGLVALSLF